MKAEATAMTAASRQAGEGPKETRAKSEPGEKGDFQRLLQTERQSGGIQPTNSAPAQLGGVQEVPKHIVQFQQQWESMRLGIDRRISRLPEKSRSLIELQVLINDLGVQTQMITRLGDTVSSTIRKLQQMGSG